MYLVGSSNWAVPSVFVILMATIHTSSQREIFANCDEYLEGGGFLLFDDSSDGSGYEVCRVVQEVLKNGRYELVAKNPNYFFRKNK